MVRLHTLSKIVLFSPSQAFDALHAELKNKEPPIPHQTIVRARCYHNAVVEERRIFDCIALKALC